MKTLTITWSSYNNYGTLLQAYALQQKLEQLGCENEILYDAEVLRRQFAGKDRRKAAENGSDSLGQKLARLLRCPGRLGRKALSRTNAAAYQRPFTASREASEAFRREALKIRYDVPVEEFSGLDRDYDAFVCGSDQVWSVFDEVFNPFYYLDFTAKPKIAYAPSMGTDRIPPQRAEQIRALVQDFTAISVREESSARRLEEITGRAVSWVLDPTLLHERSFWEQFTDGAEAPSGKYLLCYFLRNQPWYFDYAMTLARKMKLKLVLIPSDWEYLQYPFITGFGVGPREFVNLFRNAAFVLTDSYHGSIFSTIFDRDFLYLQRFRDDDPESQNIRIHSLFGALGLGDRIVTQDRKPARITPIDFGAVHATLANLRRSSITFLRESLEKIP